MKETYKDCFNMLCGKSVGRGIHRKVFECKLRPDLVVKVESSDYRYFANVMEMNFWNEHQYYKNIAQWLAPCEYLSPDGRILLQRKAAPIIDESQLPKNLPSFLTDLKMDNFGILDDRVVCVDYALHMTTASTRMIKARWNL